MTMMWRSERSRRDTYLASAWLDGIEVPRATLELTDRLNEMNVSVGRQIAIILGCYRKR